MSIHPPTERIWWKEPIPRTEMVWITVAFVWGLVMFFMMIYWHAVGEQNLSNEAYRIDPDKFAERTEAMAAKYTVRTEGENEDPVVRPPPGSDVYMLGRRWEWWPILELEKGQSYRLHIASLDWQHGFSLQPININLSIQPGYEMVVNLTPTTSGVYTVVCNEFCGIGHSEMLGRIHVVDK